MSKANNKLTEGFIYAEIDNGKTEISRKRLSEMHRNQKLAEGRNPKKGSGGPTTDVMAQFANSNSSWDLIDDGRDKAGRRINPRLVQID
jgi:hypothetical protein